MHPEIISFDAGGTLIRPFPSVGHVYARHAQPFGVRADPVELNRRFKDAFSQTIQDTRGTPVDKAFWRTVVDRTMDDLLNDADREPFFDAVFEAFGHGDCWTPCPGAESTLRTLKAREYRLVVLSNNDSRLRTILKEMNLDGFFEAVFISEEIGAEKPDAPIFETVTAALGVHPRKILHVGDSLEADGNGPVLAGWHAVLVEPARDPKGMIPSISHLPHLLKLL